MYKIIILKIKITTITVIVNIIDHIFILDILDYFLLLLPRRNVNIKLYNNKHLNIII